MYNIEEMKRELFDLGDFSVAEIEKMTIGEIVANWTSLPPVII